VETNAATIVLVPHNNFERASRCLSRDIVPSLQHYQDWRFELIVVDNSERRMNELAEAVEGLPWPSQYIWHNGANLFYGPALNLAANLAAHPVLVYACTNHGRMIDPGWLEDLVRPFWEDDRVAMTGYPYPSQPASELGFRDTGEQFHIQGGLLGLRTDVIKRHPYDEGQYAHWGSDVWQSYRLLEAGFLLRHVPSIISVWREKAPCGPWKYVHDYFEE
jgi:GT2 family glycosyltransferase